MTKLNPGNRVVLIVPNPVHGPDRHRDYPGEYTLKNRRLIHNRAYWSLEEVNGELFPVSIIKRISK